MAIRPEDSASQTGNLKERNERFMKDEEPMSQESQAIVATRLRDNVKSYITTCEQLKKVLAAARELRKERKNLERNLITDMSVLDVENLQLKQGQLVAKRSMPKVPLTKSAVLSALSKNLPDQDLVTNIMDILYNKRDRYEKVELKHNSKKQT